MKTYNLILTIFLTLTTLVSSLQANNISTKCVNDNLQLFITNDKLSLTEDAIVDNTGGYVDIPEEKLYLKSKNKLYKLKGKVVKNKENINELQTFIEKHILKELVAQKSLKIIQKIELEEHNKNSKKENIITTNIIQISLNKPIQKCLE